MRRAYAPRSVCEIVVPAGRKHGFANNSATTLRIQSTLAEPIVEAAYDDKRETPRRWLPGQAQSQLMFCLGRSLPEIGNDPTDSIRAEFLNEDAQQGLVSRWALRRT